MYYFFVIFPLTTHDLISFLSTASFRTYLEGFYYLQLNFITMMMVPVKLLAAGLRLRRTSLVSLQTGPGNLPLDRPSAY